MKNKSIAEFANIRVEILSGFLTTMLLFDLTAITLTIAIINSRDDSLRQLAIMLFVLGAVSGLVLYLLAKRYLDSVLHRFVSIEREKMEAIAKVARRFFLPFILCLVTNIMLVLLGAVSLFLSLL